jgi:anthranilate synthase/aminodeoxychorismate synthase-like glutamine amidotransferase
MKKRPCLKILLLDNYDSFTYNLCDYLLQTGVDCQVIRNDALSLNAFLQLDYDGVVLSPGPKRPEDAGVLLPFLKALPPKTPVLGICLGHQAIGCVFGATLKLSPIPMHGKTSKIIHENHFIFENCPNPLEVMRYHSLLLEDLEGTPLRSIAHTEQGEIMALMHETLPIVGLQFHPESILTECGLLLIDNWVKSIDKTSP